MPKLKLTYFDMNAGRGEVNRLAMAIGGIEFEDERIPFQEWAALKESTPFGQLPVLEVDGERLTQCNAISRYVGRLGGLYPDDALDGLRCDEALDAIEDIMNKIVPTLFIKDEEEKRQAREQLAEGPIPFYVTRLGKRLQDRGGEYFAGGKLTVADIKVCLWIRHIRSGMLDYVPTDIPDRLAPNLVEHFERVISHPAVVAWYEAH